MVELFVIVEGWTERNFVRQVLSPWLSSLAINAKASLVGESGHNGGLRSYEKIRRQLDRWMKGDRRSEIRFTTMVDLYALPDDFPGFEDAAKHKDGLRRVEALEASWASEVVDTRFIPYIQLHEFEAMLFCDATKFAVAYPNREKAIAKLARIVATCEPERIDDGATTAPSKRILTVIPEYQKPVAGPQIAEAIGLDTIRAKCPHFDGWLKKLEALGRTDRG